MTKTTLNRINPVVRPACGPVMGEYRDNVAIFRGIPYGANCDGTARFLPPKPAEKWTEVRSCTENGPIACQNGGSISGSQGLGPYFSGGEPEKFGVLNETQNENCLVLNVLSPDLNGKNPVLVYIHGGGFASGSGSLAIGGDRFVREQNIVLVSVNHRLNVFGYLYLGDFDEKYAKSGIAGILDLVLALEWVRDNIEAFGGDPGNVTIIGESGGAMKVNILMSLDCAKGLFHKAIAESGSAPIMTTPKEQATETARIILDRLGISPDDLTPLASVTTERIQAATSGKYSQLLGFSPVADGEIAKYNSDGTYATATGSDVPLMVGSSEDELAVFIAPGKKDGKNVVDDNTLRNYLLGNAPTALLPINGASIDEHNVDDIIEAFRENNPKDDDADHLAMKICSICSALGGGAYYQAMAKAAINTQPVYHYLVRYDAPHPMIEGSRYSWHTADLPLQFRVVLHDECEPISLILSNMIASFARTGVPECGGLKWPVFTPEKQETIVFDDICHVETNPNAILRRTLGLL